MLYTVVNYQLGRACHFLEISMTNNNKTEDVKMNDRQSDSLIVPLRLGNASGGKGIT